MEILEKKQLIVNWLKEYALKNKSDGFVIGISGGVDSALTSTLCCLTGLNVIVVTLPIHQHENQLNRANKHMNWLEKKFKNVSKLTINLTEVFNIFKNTYSMTELAEANLRSRMRMTSLYSIANSNNMLVVGTGNKVEDFGIGFFTKYGDGGVDISPIADLLKSEVREMSRDLNILEELCNAIATDGLWEDSRTDEEQIGASYEELEWALKYYNKHGMITFNLSEREKQVLNIYVNRHEKNKHKMLMPPICFLGENL